MKKRVLAICLLCSMLILPSAAADGQVEIECGNSCGVVAANLYTYMLAMGVPLLDANFAAQIIYWDCWLDCATN